MDFSLNRRRVLQYGLAGSSLAFAPKMAFARSTGDKRLVFVIQRGAADPLGTLGVPGDPAFEPARRILAEEFADQPKIGGLFAFNPALEKTRQLFESGEVLFAPAIASTYRERSHFDAQNILETGGDAPYALKDGWLNRLLGLLEGPEARAIALAATAPPVLRGSHPVSSYAPSGLPDARAGLLARVSQLYAEDEQLDTLWEDALRTREIAADNPVRRRDPAAAGKFAASMLTAQDGARIATIETTRWDTHYDQRGRMRRLLTELDTMLFALREGLAEKWQDTLVIVATEFGRTVKINGTNGTDHGTGSLAWLLGGRVRGGTIVGDWPGLSASQLYQQRDLMPVLSFEALTAGAIAEHYRLDPSLVAKTLFPVLDQKAMEGLVRG